MKINKRLWRIYLLMVVGPVLAIVLVTGIIVERQLTQFEKEFQITKRDYQILTNPVISMNYVLDREYQRLVKEIDSAPEKFVKEQNLEQYNDSIKKRDGALYVIKNEELVYSGADCRGWEGIALVQSRKEGMSNEIFQADGTNSVIGKSYRFTTQDGNQYVAVVILQLNKVFPGTHTILWTMMLGIVAIVLLSGMGLAIFTSFGIMKPIRRLQIATKQISQGNLDFSVETKREDEIGQLCNDFEQMRIRLKESSEEKINQDKQNRILISNICHDLKTPITSIQGYVEGLMDGVANTPEKQEKYIRTIHNKANEMNTLINELTIYSKLDTNRIPYNFQKITVKGYFDDYMGELLDEMEAENVRLSYSNYCSDDTVIIADPEQLARVIHNLISNAVKYMNKEAKMIHVRIKDVGDFIQVEVEDNGKGIANKDLPYIFERFYRADSSRNETKGSGIGLSIVQKIMDDHNGKIWATSKENVGTTMYFVLRKYQEVPNE